MKDRQLWPMVSEPLAPASGASAGAEQGGRSLPSGQKEEREPGPPHALCKLHLLKLHPLTGSQAGPALELAPRPSDLHPHHGAHSVLLARL